MKKEELTALGLEQDVIDKIFAMNGKDRITPACAGNTLG